MSQDGSNGGPDVDVEQVDAAAEQLEDAGEDVGNRTVWFARAFVTLVIATIIGGLAAGVYFDYLVLDQIVLTGEVDIGTPVTYALTAFLGLVVLFFGSMVLISLPFTFWSSLLSTISRLAEAWPPEQYR